MRVFYSAAFENLCPEFVRQFNTDKIHSVLGMVPVIQTVIGVFSALVNSGAFITFLLIFRKGPEAYDRQCDEMAADFRSFKINRPEEAPDLGEVQIRIRNANCEANAQYFEKHKGEHGRLGYGIFEGLVTAIPVLGTLFHAHRLYYGTDPFCLKNWRPISSTP